VDKARNDLSAAVPKFCLALEEYRRTSDGRVRTAQEFVASFFPHDDKSSEDRIFKHLSNEARGPIIAAWGVRGIKAALRDSDDKVQGVVHDALVAGDIDPATFEEGLSPETLVRWVPLPELWAFWRAGKLGKQAIGKALTTAVELSMFDARWFLENLHAKTNGATGTDVLSEGLSKEDLAAWIRRIHETGDGTPKGLVAALGWEKIVSTTSNEALLAVLDAMAVKAGLGTKTSNSIPPGNGDAHGTGSDELLPFEDIIAATAALGESNVSGDASFAAPFVTEEGINIVLEDELIVAEENVPSRPSERDRPHGRFGGKNK